MSVKPTARTGIVHFQKMNDEDFIQFVRHVANHLKGKISNLKTVMKVDGVPIRFGRDKTGKKFFEQYKFGVGFKRGDFAGFASASGGGEWVTARAAHLDDVLDHLMKSKIFNGIPNDTKIVAELFYNPIGTEEDELIKFVTVKYDKSKLGKLMTILPFNAVIASSGEDHPKEAHVLNAIQKLSSPDILVTSPNLKMGTIDLTGLINPIKTIDDDAMRVLKSRKAADAEDKKALRQILDKTKEDMADYILKHPEIVDKFKLGPNIEGLVLHIGGKVFKITTPEFKSTIAAKRKPINEAVEYLPKAAKACDLFLGRMQPVHNGHAKIIKSMTNPVIALVKGAKTSADRSKNPLDATYQTTLIKKIAPNVKVVVVPSGYIPDIINYLRDDGLEVKTVYAGADRIAGYKKQLDSFNTKAEDDVKMNVTFKETERVTSATVVRETIRGNDEAKFKTLVPQPIWGEFKKLQKLIKESTIMEPNLNIKTLAEVLEESRKWREKNLAGLLNEEEGGDGGEGDGGEAQDEADDKKSNSSKKIARKDQPLKDKFERRLKEQAESLRKLPKITPESAGPTNQAGQGPDPSSQEAMPPCADDGVNKKDESGKKPDKATEGKQGQSETAKAPTEK